MRYAKRKRLRLGMIALGGLVILCIAATGVAIVGNDYRLTQERVSIPTRGGTLDGVLATPREGQVRGLVVVVHGDGPVDATHDGLYLPWFEAAADAGYATLSWSKPGIGGSSGHWLAQSMDDRASEVSAVIDWAAGQADVPTDRIVLWGASQAGWVVPKVASSRDDIDAIVAVGPAINWLRQGRYHLLAGLEHDRASASERERAIGVSDRTLDLLEQNADYDTYLARSGDPEPMSRDRWAFVARNYTSDATADLTAMASRRVPVLLMLGDHDRNVDVAETATTYRRLLTDSVTVRHVDAAHSMARTAVEDSPSLGLITAVVWPRALMAEGVLPTYEAYLGEVARGGGAGRPSR